MGEDKTNKSTSEQPVEPDQNEMQQNEEKGQEKQETISAPETTGSPSDTMEQSQPDKVNTPANEQGESLNPTSQEGVENETVSETTPDTPSHPETTVESAVSAEGQPEASSEGEATEASGDTPEQPAPVPDEAAPEPEAATTPEVAESTGETASPETSEAEQEPQPVQEQAATPVADSGDESSAQAEKEEPAEGEPAPPAAESEADKPDAEAPESESAAGEGQEQPAGEPEEEVSEEEKLLDSIIRNNDNFDKALETGNPTELVFLLERIVSLETDLELIGKVSMLKRAFDKFQKSEDIELETSILSRFNTSLAKFNKKRSQFYEQLEVEKAENSKKKEELLNELKSIVEEERVEDIQKVREIQNRWRDIGWVLQKDVKSLNERYKFYLDIYYNLRSKYNELRELDRKYNLEQKEGLIGQVKGMLGENIPSDRETWNKATQEIKKIQEKWKTIGHVPRENADEINTTYRDLLNEFFDTRSGFYDDQDKEKEANAEKKSALLERLKPFEEFKSNKARDWNEATKAVLALQEEWKSLGPAPTSMNRTLWKEYRSICDTFFEKKGSYFKDFDKERAENLKRKIEICEEAETLMNSENWSETAEALKALQAEWKTIGPVHERHSNKVWKRFRNACDHFFNRKSELANSKFNEQKANLKIKEGLIAEVQKMLESDNLEEHLEAFQKAQATWKNTGHVPFRDKDKINNAFRKAADAFYDKLELKDSEVGMIRMETKLNSIVDDDLRSRRIKAEMGKIRKKLDATREKVESYETNILYIAKGKKGDALRAQIQKQIDEEKEKLNEWRDKLKKLRHLLENPPENQPEPPQETPEEKPEQQASETSETKEASEEGSQEENKDDNAEKEA